MTEPRVRSGEHIVRDIGWDSRTRVERQAQAAAKRAVQDEERRVKETEEREKARRYDEGIVLLAKLQEQRQREEEEEEANFAKGLKGVDDGEDEAEGMDVDVDDDDAYPTPKAPKVSAPLIRSRSALTSLLLSTRSSRFTLASSLCSQHPFCTSKNQPTGVGASTSGTMRMVTRKLSCLVRCALFVSSSSVSY